LYFDYDEKHKKVYRKNGDRYTVNPAFMVWNRDNYYMLCFSNGHDDMVTYRLDKMENVKVEEAEREPHPEYELFNTEEYRKQVFSMFGGETQKVTLLFTPKILSDMKKAILYIHGKGGSYLEAEAYKKNCAGFDIIGVDYKDYFPWSVEKQIKTAYDKVHKKYKHICLLANSIGAYFAMYALQNCQLEKALFISPVLDMERLILDMLEKANVSEKELQAKGEVSTEFGETLSWKYLCFVRENPIEWNIFTEILYAGKDNLTSRETVENFFETHNAALTVMENGEHWFHTEEQIAFLDEWMKKRFE
jgi:hypothetical protein